MQKDIKTPVQRMHLQPRFLLLVKSKLVMLFLKVDKDSEFLICEGSSFHM